MDPRPQPLRSHHTHVEKVRWPLLCPNPWCDVTLCSEPDFRFHLMDEHGLSRTRQKNQVNAADGKLGRKRKAAGAVGELSWVSDQQFSSSPPPWKVRYGSLTIAPSLLTNMDARVKSPPSPIDLTLSDSSTNVLKEILSVQETMSVISSRSRNLLLDLDPATARPSTQGRTASFRSSFALPRWEMCPLPIRPIRLVRRLLMHVTKVFLRGLPPSLATSCRPVPIPELYSPQKIP